MSFPTRRRILLWSGTVVIGGLAGCSSDDNTEDDDDTGDDDEPADGERTSEEMEETQDEETTELVCPPTTNSESRQLLPELDGFTDLDTVEISLNTDVVSRIYEGPEEELYAVQIEIYDSEEDAGETEPRAFGRRIEQDDLTVEPEEMILGRVGAVTFEVLGDDVSSIEALYEAGPCFDEGAVVGRTWE